MNSTETMVLVKEVSASTEQQRADLQRFEVIVTIIENNMQRQHKYKDPVVQSCVFLEKLVMTCDVLSGMLSIGFGDTDIPPELNNRVKQLTANINESVEVLMDLIQRPINESI